MKTTLGYDRTLGQHKVDIGKPSKRFRLGKDEAIAQQRKERLGEFWDRCKAKGEGWTDENFTIAKAIAKGKPVDLRRDGGTTEENVGHILAKLPTGTPTLQTATLEDFTAAMMAQVARLEDRLREVAGQGAVDAPTITVHSALDAFIQYRQETEIDPDTGKEREAITTQRNTVKLVKRLIDPALKLSALTATELHRWCKAIVVYCFSRNWRTGPSALHLWTVPNGANSCLPTDAALPGPRSWPFSGST